MSVLTFDEKTHTYYLDGVVIPGVTRALNVLGGYEGIPKHILQAAAERGTIVHKLTELNDLGQLDIGEVPDEYLGYLMGWLKFLDDKKPELLLIEHRTHHPTLKVGGTLDRGLILDGKKTILDIKSSYKLMPATGPQTAAYMEFTNAHIKEKSEHYKGRVGLKLKADGTYELQHYKDAGDFNTFVSCLNCYRWIEKHQPKRLNYYAI